MSDVGATGSGDKRMTLRYTGVCRVCAAVLDAGTAAIYERGSRTVRCLGCAAGAAPDESSRHSRGTARPVEAGIAGSSAQREFARRRDAREARIRAKHPTLGGLILALSDDPQSTKAWATGAQGERRLGARLDSVAGPSVRFLHDRRIPRTRANIDHIAVCPSGVFVIDAKRYTGRPTLRAEGGFRQVRTERLCVGSRDCTRLVDGVLKQVERVQGVLGEGEQPAVRGFLCFVDADWPLIGGSFSTRGVGVLWPKKMLSLISAPGGLDADAVESLHHRLAAKFPMA